MSTAKSNKPDFIIVGTMKSGTTTLYRWLQVVTGSQLCKFKEPNFFSDDKLYHRGLGWYQRLFPDNSIAGEASTSYTYPDRAGIAATRIASMQPSPKLIVLVRNPLDRARSHYRHQVTAGRERRPFREAVSADNSLYVRQSRYDEVLRPYLKTFRNILVVQSEDLFGQSDQAWLRLLAYLGIEPTPRPNVKANVSANKTPSTALMRRIRDSRIALAALRKTTPFVPARARKSLKPMLYRDDEFVRRLVRSSYDEFPSHLVADLVNSMKMLASLTRVNLDLWKVPASPEN